jgi:hypothetical protein
MPMLSHNRTMPRDPIGLSACLLLVLSFALRR